MPDRLLKRKEVEEMLGLSTTGLYKNVRNGLLPAPLKISPGAVRWRLSELEKCLAEKPRATGNA